MKDIDIREQRVVENVKKAYKFYSKALMSGLISKGNEKMVLMETLIEYVGVDDMKWYNEKHKDK